MCVGVRVDVSLVHVRTQGGGHLVASRRTARLPAARIDTALQRLPQRTRLIPRPCEPSPLQAPAAQHLGSCAVALPPDYASSSNRRCRRSSLLLRSASSCSSASLSTRSRSRASRLTIPNSHLRAASAPGPSACDGQAYNPAAQHFFESPSPDPGRNARVGLPLDARGHSPHHMHPAVPA